MHELPKSIQNAIEALSNLPGIGRRSAERLVFSLLKNKTNLDKKLALAFGELKEKVQECQISHNYCEGNFCPLAINPNRDDRIICVVETPMDLIAIERTGEFRGRYHVLHGAISPLNKISPENLRITELVERVKQTDQILEIILAMSGNIEGEATAFYITEKLKTVFTGKISRLARGIPAGGDLDYLDAGTLSRAISDRRVF